MIHAIRKDVVVLPGGRIEIVSSELTPGAHAEVIVLENAPRTRKRAVKGHTDAGGRPSAARKEAERVSGKSTEPDTEEPLTLAQRRAFLKLPLPERRRILAEQAERMADFYEQDAEVLNLGGGDFLDC